MFIAPLIGFLAGTASAQAGSIDEPARRQVEVGAELFALSVSELPAGPTPGYAPALRVGLGISRWSMNLRLLYGEIAYSDVPGSYRHRQLELVGRYSFPPGQAVQAYIEALASTNLDKVDRGGARSDVDKIGAGAGFGGGAGLPLGRRWVVDLGADLRLGTVLVGRLATGEWEKPADRLFDLTARAHLGLAWRAPLGRRERSSAGAGLQPAGRRP